MTSAVSLPNIQIDDSILLTLKETKETLASQMKLYTAIMLYKKDKLSLGKAALFADMNKAEFLKAMEKENIPVFDFDTETMKQIVDDSRF
ncbi:MAG: UPF0175 family protein [Arcobacteraceae bacterium]|jgi:predicted HTH domain antitoxin|nr:UPF0175 family protein [Arcobacteraceae bacterium]